MGFILPALSIVSAVSSFAQQKKAASAQKKSNAAAMAAATEEARLTREDAASAALNEKKAAMKTRGEQLAAYLKSGVTLDGSPLLLASETIDSGDRNAQNTIDNAESRAKSLVLRGQASQDYVQKADVFGTASTLFTQGKKLAG